MENPSETEKKQNNAGDALDGLQRGEPNNIDATIVIHLRASRMSSFFVNALFFFAH